MALEFFDLDNETRVYMRAEFQRDVDSRRLYISRYLSDGGRGRYAEMLQQALEHGDDSTLAAALSQPGVFLERYEKRKPSGGTSFANVPYTAPQTLAEGEFNRFFLRGLCLRATAEGQGRVVEIYRARASANPRPESEALIGTAIDPSALLSDLRDSIGVDTALGLPPGPNSGLSGRLSQG